MDLEPVSVSVAVTVKNEEGSIERLLDCLFGQTVRPAEVVIADGGSDDRTVELIEASRRRGCPVQLVSVPGACRGRGRNAAIAASRSALVALTDGGCFPEPTWLEELLRVFRATPAPDAVFGVVRPMTGTRFTECVATATLPAMRLPGGRRALGDSVASLLLRRSVWERSGGFVEGLRTGEDLLFVRLLREHALRIGLAPAAVVQWQIPLTLSATFRRFATYSHHGLEAGLGHTWHYRAFLIYAVALALGGLGLVSSPWWFAVLAALFVVRVIHTIVRNEHARRGLRAFAPMRVLLIGVILLAVDVATLYGTCRWLIRPTRRTGMAMAVST
jgi:glycosyltransferase involved in cell wall biosynthesis